MEHKLSIVWQGQTFATDFATLPEASQRYLIEYGFKQALGDARAMTKEEKEEHGEAAAQVMLDKMQAKFDRLVAGTITERANSAEPKDPAERHRQAVIMEILKSIAAAKGIKLPKRTGPKADPEKLEALCAKVYEAKKAQIDAEVKKRLTSKMDLGEIDLDL